jgi:hypothetical protein
VAMIGRPVILCRKELGGWIGFLKDLWLSSESTGCLMCARYSGVSMNDAKMFASSILTCFHSYIPLGSNTVPSIFRHIYAHQCLTRHPRSSSSSESPSESDSESELSLDPDPDFEFDTESSSSVC